MSLSSYSNLRKKQIPSLGGLRAVSIIIVIVGHLIENHYVEMNPNSICYLFVDSGFGVNIFFVISGFLITILLLIEENNYQTISLKKFYIRRIIRIFPAYYFVILVYGILEFYFHIIHFSAISWLTTLTFTKYLSPQFDWTSAHFWSLSVEEHFYLFFPFIFKFKVYRNKILLLSIFIVCVLRFLIFYHKLGFFNNDFASYNVTIFQRGDAIAIGCLVALNYERVSEFIILLQKTIKYPVLISMILIFLYKSLFSIFHLHLGLMYKLIGLDATSTFANFCIAIILVSSIEFENTLWYKCLNMSFIKYIGVLSYSIYLWQQLFIKYQPTYFFQKMPYNFIFIIFFASTSYNLIERPFLRLKNRFKISKFQN